MKAYNPHEIEVRWQKIWADSDIFKADEDPSKPKKYVLEMFPYPSGDIHMGHVRNYTIGDVMARYARMRGFDVLHTIGWDAFGLPAENAAIKHHSHPATWTYANIEAQKESFKRMGFSYDWDRSLATSDPDYYRWGQWIFLQFWKHGLVERRNSPVNWCPHCETVLANEQVIEGVCWRCDHEVEKRDLTQWYFKITDYAQELLDDLDGLSGWPERVKQMQAHWIGRSEGAEVDFTLVPLIARESQNSETVITVFTTRVDTLFGCSFFLLAPEYPGLVDLVEGTGHEADVRAVVEQATKMSAVERSQGDRPKHGAFTGRYVVNPINGQKVEVWVADYVLSDYGTGAVMAVPCGDQRDFEFARAYNLPIVPIILGEHDPLFAQLNGVQTCEVSQVEWERAFEAEGILVQSGPYTGLRGGKKSPAVDAIIADLEATGKGRKKVEFRLRDWLISRQRYWGNPIPALYCQKCGLVPVPEDDLPVLLPQNINLGAGETLALDEDFVNTACPVCGGPAKRETDTMDTFACSSWYFLRYTDPHNQNLAFAPSKADRWMPVDEYIGGIEHAILHLLYSRFYTKVLRDIGMVNFGEPFKNLLTQGMVLDENGEVMSKSKGNVISPEEMIAAYGADAVRTYILFMAPPDKELQWNEDGLAGIFKFMNRAWRLIHDLMGKAAEETLYTKGCSDADIKRAAQTLRRERHRVVGKVMDDFERSTFNTAIAAIMELCNATADFLRKASAESRMNDHDLCDLSHDVAEVLLKLMAPMAPHWAEELWHTVIGREGNLYMEPWPTFDPERAKADEVELAVQVNGKVKARITTPIGQEEEGVKTAALSAVHKYIQGKDVQKVIVIKDRVVSIVVK